MRTQPSDFEKRWRQRFAEFARLHDDDAGVAGWSPSGLQTRFRFFTSRWGGARRHALYLDVGCGAGTYSRWLADAGLQVVGVDYSPPALMKARQRDATRISYCAADASRLPFPDASVDGILCFGVLQAVKHSQPFVAEAARVLKPGGEFWIDALNATGPLALWDQARRRFQRKPMHLRYESSRRLLAALRGAGFSDLTLHWLLMMPAGQPALQAFCESRPLRYALRTVPMLGALTSHSFLIRGVRNGVARAG
jgi:SAM-dependent methyltransferase